MTFCMWQLTLTSSCAAWTAFITLTALSWGFFDTCAVQCVTCCSLTAFFSLLCINLQVNMPLYLLWSPWTHLKTCGSLPLLNAFLPFPHHLPSSSRPLFLAQSTPSTPPRCHYFLPSSSLLIISSFFNQEVFFFTSSVVCHNHHGKTRQNISWEIVSREKSKHCNVQRSLHDDFNFNESSAESAEIKVLFNYKYCMKSESGAAEGLADLESAA